MAAKKKDTEQVQAPTDNVDQIREILFGGHIRAVDERFETVEKRLSRESDALRKTLEKRIQELEKLLGQYSDNSGDQINREGAEREAGIARLSESLTALRLDTDNQLAELQSEFNAEIKQLHQDLEAAKMALKSELSALQADQTKRADLLNEAKVDREELAELLSGVAGKLAPASKKK